MPHHPDRALSYKEFDERERMLLESFRPLYDQLIESSANVIFDVIAGNYPKVLRWYPLDGSLYNLGVNMYQFVFPDTLGKKRILRIGASKYPVWETFLAAASPVTHINPHVYPGDSDFVIEDERVRIDDPAVTIEKEIAIVPRNQHALTCCTYSRRTDWKMVRYESIGGLDEDGTVRLHRWAKVVAAIQVALDG